MKEAIITKLRNVTATIEEKDTTDSRVAIEEAVAMLEAPATFIPNDFELGLLVTGLACYFTDRHKKLKRAKAAKNPGHSPAAFAMELASVHELFEKLKKITDGIKAEAKERAEAMKKGAAIAGRSVTP